MPSKSISFGDLHFGKKGDALAFLQAILHKYDVGDKVSSDDAAVLLSALVHHPDAKEKLGAGVVDFSVRSAEYGTKCFWVNRIDDTSVKFSHKSCVYGRRKS